MPNELEYIATNYLFADLDYHRDPAQGVLEALARSCDPIVVNDRRPVSRWRVVRWWRRRRGPFWIVDGVARFEAMRRLGITKVPCRIEHLPASDEARRFVELNSGRPTRRES